MHAYAYGAGGARPAGPPVRMQAAEESLHYLQRGIDEATANQSRLAGLLERVSAVDSQRQATKLTAREEIEALQNDVEAAATELAQGLGRRIAALSTANDAGHERGHGDAGGGGPAHGGASAGRAGGGPSARLQARYGAGELTLAAEMFGLPSGGLLYAAGLLQLPVRRPPSAGAALELRAGPAAALCFAVAAAPAATPEVWVATAGCGALDGGGGSDGLGLQRFSVAEASKGTGAADGSSVLELHGNGGDGGEGVPVLQLLHEEPDVIAGWVELLGALLLPTAVDDTADDAQQAVGRAVGGGVDAPGDFTNGRASTGTPEGAAAQPDVRRWLQAAADGNQRRLAALLQQVESCEPGSEGEAAARRAQLLAAVDAGGAGLSAVHLLAGRLGQRWLEALRWLLSAGADPNQRSTGSGRTPLHSAAAAGNFAAARALLGSGADAMVLDDEGRSPAAVGWALSDGGASRRRDCHSAPPPTHP